MTGNGSSDRVATTRLTYDQVAGDYDRRTREPTAELVAFREAFTGAVDGPVADLGCGPGRDLAALRAAGLEGMGVDLSAGMLTVARGRGLPVVRGDLRRPPIRAGSLGGIWSSAALLHVPRPDVPTTLLAWHRCLRPGGRLALSTSLGSGEGWEGVPYAGGGPEDGALKRWFVHHEADALAADLAAAGFQVVDVQTRESRRTWLMITAHT